MSKLSFNNYLSKTINTKFTANNALTDPIRTFLPSLYTLVFSMVPEESYLIEQANLFAQTASAHGLLKGNFFNYSTSQSTVFKILKDCYIYSFLKSVFYSYGFIQNLEYSNFQIAGNNFVFGGHRYLHDIIIYGSYFNEFVGQSRISVEMLNSEDPVSRIQDFQCFDEYVDDITGRLFRPDLELAMSYLKTSDSAKDVLDIRELVKENYVCKTFSNVPLGNLAFNPTMNIINYLEHDGLKSDKKSFLWGKACFITLVEVPTIDVDDNVYATVPIERMSLNNLLYTEVESITGFNPLTYVQKVDVQPKGTQGTVEPEGGKGGNKAFISKNLNSQNKQRNNGKRNTNNLNKVLQVTKNTWKLISQGGSFITNDNLQTVIDVINIQFNKSLSGKQKSSLLGLTIKDALKRHGVPDSLFDSKSNFAKEEVQLLLEGSNKYVPVSLKSLTAS